jgi:hypothetical protein
MRSRSLSTRWRVAWNQHKSACNGPRNAKAKPSELSWNLIARPFWRGCCHVAQVGGISARARRALGVDAQFLVEQLALDVVVDLSSTGRRRCKA